MEVTSKTTDGIGIVKVSGRMIFEDSLFVLREHVQKARRARYAAKGVA